jgi:hypothetical protein
MSAFRRALVAPTVVLGVAGCSFLSLDNLAGGEGGGSSSVSASSSGVGVGPTSTSATSSGSGGAGAGTASSSATGEGGAGGSGGDCPGCVDEEGECHPGLEVDACGAAGAACVFCDPPRNPCEVATCEAGACGSEASPDGSPCEDGACVDGVCTIGAENCLNGVDDEDADEDVDCADDDCADYQCSAQTPPGFVGPYLTLTGDGAAECPVGLRLVSVLHTEPEGACACEEPTFDDCEAQLSLDQPGCDAASNVVAVDASCEAIPVEATFGVESSTTTQTCSSDGMADAVTQKVTLCELPGGGCDRGAACVPPLDGGALVCVLHRNPSQQCPAGFPVRRVAADVDAVSCACSCTVATSSCLVKIQIWDDPLCSTCRGGESPCATFDAPSALCTAVTASGAAPFARAVTQGNGTARVEGGEVVLAGSQLGLCCAP